MAAVGVKGLIRISLVEQNLTKNEKPNEWLMKRKPDSLRRGCCRPLFYMQRHSVARQRKSNRKYIALFLSSLPPLTVADSVSNSVFRFIVQLAGTHLLSRWTTKWLLSGDHHRVACLY